MIRASARNEALRAHLSLGDEAPRAIGQSPYAICAALAGAVELPLMLHTPGVRDGHCGSRMGRAPRP